MHECYAMHILEKKKKKEKRKREQNNKEEWSQRVER